MPVSCQFSLINTDFCFTVWLYFGLALSYFRFHRHNTDFGRGADILTLKINPPKKTKIFLLLAGGSAVGVPVFAVMHNLVYAVLTHYWGETIGDEPFFFILATIICPLGLLIGLIGSFIRYRHIAEQPE